MKILSLLLLSICLSFCASAQTVRATISKVLDETEKFERRESNSDTIGNPFSSLAKPDLLRRYEFYVSQVKVLNSIPTDSLSASDKADVELIKYSFQDNINYYEYKEYLNPIMTDGGFHVDMVYRTSTTFRSANDAKRYLNWLKHIPAYVNQQIELMREGLALGISQPVAALTGFESTYTMHIVNDVEKSVFYNAFKTKPAAISESEWNTLTARAKQLVNDSVVYAFKNLKTFFEGEYFPKARKTIGVYAFPNGKTYYDALVKYHTTTNMTADDVFEIGVKEVARIKSEMETVIKETGFKGSFKDFLNFLRTDKRFYATTPEQLLKEASFIAKKIDGNLPQLFGRLPRAPYGIKPVPDHLAPSYTAGRGGLGTYWVNTYDLPSRTLYTLEALTLHEAVPGHHLQQALSSELTNVSPFRRRFYVNAFGEGWGLYCEYLGYELGLYKDPYSRFGRLTYEMWRACRLVVDVGMHAKGWSREKAVEFLSSNSALSLHEVNTEINRYIRWPGQALSYKIGELKILELRRRAEAALKEKFDVRVFHDLLLSQGSVTLSILETIVDDYIKAAVNK
jgi:uncharacterized protein (DUF885 family)